MENNKISKNAVRAFTMVAVLAICTTAQALEVILGTGLIKSPLFDGAFSDTSIGNAATVFLCLTDANTYNTYASDSRGLYDAWKDGAFNGEEYRYEGTTAESGIREATFFPTVEDYIYYVSIAEYASEEYGRLYYIATTGESAVGDTSSSFAVHYLAGTISGAGNWSPVPEPTTVTLLFAGFSVALLKRRKETVIS